MKNERYIGTTFIALFIFLSPCISFSQQISIISAGVSPYNVSTRGLCQVAIMNPGVSVQAIMQVNLLDAANEPLVTIATNPFVLHNGLNTTSSMNFTFSSVVYGSTSIVNFIKNSNVLPTGIYNYCVKIITPNNAEGDIECQELESDITSYLYLINPEDKDTVNSLYPILVWNHNDPLNTLSPGESYRILVCPMTEGQSPDEAITINTPIYFKNNLTELQVQYPFDAINLEAGKHYAWQVQKISNDIVISKSECWEFVEPLNLQIKDVKYAVMKDKPDGSFYETSNNRIFFRFDEQYAIGKVVECNIYDYAMKKVKMETKNSKQSDAQGIALEQQGYNQYEVDLKGFSINTGFYYLEILNGKGQKFMLKFHVN